MKKPIILLISLGIFGTTKPMEENGNQTSYTWHNFLYTVKSGSHQTQEQESYIAGTIFSEEEMLYLLSYQESPEACKQEPQKTFQHTKLPCIKKHKREQKKLIKDLIAAHASWPLLNETLLTFYVYCDIHYKILEPTCSLTYELERVIARLTYHVAYHYYQQCPFCAQKTLEVFMETKVTMQSCADIYDDIHNLLQKCQNAQSKEEPLSFIKTERL